MKNPSSTDTYLTGIGVLNDFSNELYTQTMTLYEPMVSGKNVLKIIRKSHVIRILDRITNIDTEQQEKIIDALTDLVALDIISHKDIKKKIKEKLDEISNIGKQVEIAEQQFNNLEPNLQKQVLHLSIRKIVGGISTVRKEIGHRVWIKNSNIEELIIIDQFLYKIEENLKNNFIIDPKNINSVFRYCLLLILKLEAYKRNKIKLQVLKREVSEEPPYEFELPNLKYVDISEYKTITELFGE